MHAEDYVAEALGDDAIVVARALDFLADKDSRNASSVAQLEAAKAALGNALLGMPRQIAAQAERGDLTSINVEELQRALDRADEVLRKYRLPSGRSLFPESEQGEAAVRMLRAKSSPSAIVSQVIKPAVDESKRLGQ